MPGVSWLWRGMRAGMPAKRAPAVPAPAAPAVKGRGNRGGRQAQTVAAGPPANAPSMASTSCFSVSGSVAPAQPAAASSASAAAARTAPPPPTAAPLPPTRPSGWAHRPASQPGRSGKQARAPPSTPSICSVAADQGGWRVGGWVGAGGRGALAERDVEGGVCLPLAGDRGHCHAACQLCVQLTAPPRRPVPPAPSPPGLPPRYRSVPAAAAP